MEHKIDCIIAVPGFEDKNQKHKFSNTEMLGPEYIAASIEYHGYSVSLLNAYSNNISTDEIQNQIISLKPYVSGVTCASQRSYPFTKDFVLKIRNLGYRGKIVMGGFYATLEAEKILRDLQEIDAINLGEGEFSFVEILSKVIENDIIPDISGVAYRKDGKIIVHPHHKLKDLDFPFFPNAFRLHGMQ